MGQRIQGRLRAMDILALSSLGVLLILYAWTIYNLPTLITGLRQTLHGQHSIPIGPTHITHGVSPKFSIIVAAKNEERVIGRLLDRLNSLDYSKKLYEVILAEDGSTDGTRRIGEQYAEQNPQLIRFYHSEDSLGKPHALNRALAECAGEIIAVMDADSFPNLDLLRRAAEYFDDSSVAAIQGMTLPINRDESMISKLSAYEEAAWFKVYLMGKGKRNLFVPMTGSCAFVRRDILRSLGGWDENSLAEDVELAARLTDKGWRIEYAPDVQSLQEYPAKTIQLVTQRTRWFRGYMETWVKYGRLMGTPSRLAIDAEATLFGPYVLILILLSYIMTFSGLFNYYSAASIEANILATTATTLTVATLLICGTALVWYDRPRRLRNIAWIPVVFLFWCMQTLIAAEALILMMLRWNRTWVKTEKSGSVSLQQLTKTSP